MTQRNTFRNYFNHLFLIHMSQKNKRPKNRLVPITDNMAIRNFSNLFGCFARRLDTLLSNIVEEQPAKPEELGPKANDILERMFVFYVNWSLGASGTQEARVFFDQAVKDIESRIFPSSQTVFEYKQIYVSIN